MSKAKWYFDAPLMHKNVLCVVRDSVKWLAPLLNVRDVLGSSLSIKTNCTEVFHFPHTLWGIPTYVSLATPTTGVLISP
jgi:hypothetical protein